MHDRATFRQAHPGRDRAEPFVVFQVGNSRRMMGRVSWIRLAWVCAMMSVAGEAADLRWVEHQGYRAARVIPQGNRQAGFTRMDAAETGITFVNRLPTMRHFTNQIYLNGSGVAAGDLNGDGRCDLVWCGLSGQSVIYRNTGSWKFEDVTKQSTGALQGLDATGVVLADVDGDIDLDLLVNTVGQGTLVLLNDGRGKFESPPGFAPLNTGFCGSSSALADIDGDGDLDWYVTNYRINTSRDDPDSGFEIRHVNGQPRVVSYGGRPITDPDLRHRFKFVYRETTGGGGTVFHDELGEPDALFRNEGQGRFVRVPIEQGIFLDEAGQALREPLYDWGLSVMLRDLNGDGAPDIYVCNDFSTPDRIWLNDGAGRFRPLPAEAIRQTSLSTMAVDVADLNRDGFDDIFTADMLSPDRWRRLVQINQSALNMHLFVDVRTRPQVTRNTLQINRGDGTYAELAHRAGLEGSDWSWASVFLDVDLDGYEDLLVANGFERDFMNMDAHRRVLATQARLPRDRPREEKLAANRFYPRLTTANLAFRNRGDLTFENVAKRWGFDIEEVSHGMCLADLDNDGDLDVVLNNMNGRASVLRNDTSAPRLMVRLKGRSPNTRGVGANIRVSGGSKPRQSQEILAGGRYLSSDQPARVFAAGSVDERMSIEVRWRRGARSRLTNLEPNHIYEIEEPAVSSRAEDVRPRPTERPREMFEEVGEIGQVGPMAEEPADNEFKLRPMLPFSLNREEPGLAWLDRFGLRGDRQALILAGATAAPGSVYEVTPTGEVRSESWPQTNATDSFQTSPSVAGWSSPETGTVSWLQSGTNGNAYLFTWTTSGVEASPAWLGDGMVPGPLAMADVDSDGDLEVFAGGRAVVGRWPEPASSRLFRREGDAWTLDSSHSNRLHRIGMVTGAVFSDLDGDSDPDLILACAWGPLRILRNEEGSLTEAAWELVWPDPVDRHLAGIKNLSQLTGWWNGVSTGDFDGDGRLDLIASNWGRNTKYERYRDKPLRLYYGDFIGDGRVSLLEAWYDATLDRYTPVHDVWTLSRTLPWLLARFPNYTSFARANVEEALGEFKDNAQILEAACLESCVFLNRGDRFEAHSLPDQAQWSPAYALTVHDFDGDGHEDVFLSQNFFGVRPNDSRLDAGRGLLLLGNGQGAFSVMPGQSSGIKLYEEQRAAAVGDFDRDGRADLVVARHGEPAVLLRNRGGRPGWRVRLVGPPQNPQGVGAKLRLFIGDQAGPVREIHAGSGYRSQDSGIQVLPSPASPLDTVKLQVQWPDGEMTLQTLVSDTLEVIVTHP